MHAEGYRPTVRIVSLLPSATEIVYALGLGDQLIGVTHECDFPVAARSVRQLTRTTIPHDATPAEIDAVVSSGVETNVLDTDAVAELRPDVVLSQDLCRVCAVPAGDVDRALDVIGCRADVVSLDPSTLDDVLAGIVAVGEACSAADVARLYVEQLRDRLDTVATAVKDEPRPRTFALEWADPPFNGGHWVPEMLRAAGAEPVLGADGERSRRLTWDEIADAAPEALVFMPCGFGLDEAIEQTPTFADRDELRSVQALYVVDANGCFSRPGPRLVDGVEALAAALHPNRLSNARPEVVRRVR